MPSWYQLLIGEGREASPSSEEDYLTFKKIMRGKHVPPSHARQEFLKQLRPWVFQVELEDKALPKGRALISAKEVFFDPEEGVPKFFEPQRTLRIKRWDAERTDEGWMVTIWFDAQFKRKAGKRLEPTESELEELGIFSDEPEDEPDEPEEVEEPKVFKVLVKIPREGVTQKRAVYLSGLQMKEKVRFLEKARVISHRAWEEPGLYVVEIIVEGFPTTDQLPDGVYPQ